MTEQKVWVWQGDSREDKAKRVAREYRKLVEGIAQGIVQDAGKALVALDQYWQDRGVFWMIPHDAPMDPDKWYSAADLAHLIGRVQRDIYDWARRGHIQQRLTEDGSPEYLLGSAIEYKASLRTRRKAA